MPRKCCVAGCKSNYGKVYSTVFQFPKDEERRRRWIRATHRDNYQPGAKAVICSVHFSPEYLILVDRATREDGTELVVTRKHPKLTDDAYPTIFPNLPSYLSSKSIKRKSPEERRKELETKKTLQVRKLNELDSITSFSEFKCKHPSKDLLDFTAICYETSVLFIKLDNTNTAPQILVSLRVKSDLKIEVHHNYLKVMDTEFKHVLGYDLLCNKFSKFESLLGTLNSYTVETIGLKAQVQNISTLLNTCLETPQEGDEELLKKVKFVEEQVRVALRKKPKYSPDMLIWACTVFFTYPASYRFIRNSGIMTLPHPSYLKKLSMELGTNRSGIHNSHVTYLKEKAKVLNENELVVNLLLDEIYVKPSVSFKGGKIEGLCESDCKSGASTIQAFMITSIFSKNKDVVGLFPVKSLTAEALLVLCNQVLRVLTEAGYEVVTLISDNNRVNRKMFETMCGGELKYSFKNPFNVRTDAEIFILFDTVHLFKCIRNNWLNQCDSNQSFVIPPSFGAIQDSQNECADLGEIENCSPNVKKNTSLSPSFTHDSCLTPSVKTIDQEYKYASVGHLKRLYNTEKSDFIKLAPQLSKKVLFPTPMERQNVSYVVKLFDEKNIASLKLKSTEWKVDVSGTIVFMELISKWWRVVNVKHHLKGKHLRDTACDPIRSVENDANIQFLETFAEWLDTWDNISGPETRNLKGKINKRHGKLTSETSFSLKHTTLTLIALSKYLLTEKKMSYVLLGKFQTDSLEGRFGQYRQMCGGNYHVSVIQILESEKKLKLISLVNLTSAKSGDFQIKTFLSNCAESASDDRVDVDIDDCFEDAVSLADVIDVTESNHRVLIYIAGYVARHVNERSKCNLCKSSLSYDHNLEIECESDVFDYLKVIDRGGLKWPKDITVQIAMHTFQMFQSLISSRFEEKFLACKNQRSAMQILTIEKLELNDVLKSTCACGVSMTVLAGRIVRIVSNILLNNYSKVKNDCLQDNCKKNKKRKLKTLTD